MVQQRVNDSGFKKMAIVIDFRIKSAREWARK